VQNRVHAWGIPRSEDLMQSHYKADKIQSASAVARVIQGGSIVSFSVLANVKKSRKQKHIVVRKLLTLILCFRLLREVFLMSNCSKVALASSIT
jgi:hypothetical protein